MWMLTLVALATSPAQACEGGQKCTDGKCTMAPLHAEADAAEVEAAQAEPTATTIVLSVAGMKCGACSAKITTALEGIEGVTAAAVDHESGTAEIVVAPDTATADALVAVVADLGYEATVTPE
jgi:copper chaperone